MLWQRRGKLESVPCKLSIRSNWQKGTSIRFLETRTRIRYLGIPIGLMSILAPVGVASDLPINLGSYAD